MYYQFVFQVRRSLFIAITFALFDKVGLQLHLMIAMTVLYIAYLGYSDIHLTFYGKVLEMTNESVFVVIQYGFVLLHELVQRSDIRIQIGNLIIVLTSLLLAINLVVSIVTSLRPFLRRKYLERIKKRNIKEYKANLHI